MKYILVTGSGGLVGNESVSFFINKGYRIIGIDNNYRKRFFGKADLEEKAILHLGCATGYPILLRYPSEAFQEVGKWRFAPLLFRANPLGS